MYPISETFYKSEMLYYVESQHEEGQNIYRCINTLDEDDVVFLNYSEIDWYIERDWFPQSNA